MEKTFDDNSSSGRGNGNTDSIGELPLPSWEHQVAIPLDPGLLKALGANRNRRLRAVQAACKVRTTLDRINSVVRVTGTAENVNAFHARILNFGGKEKRVPEALWAELMRTRMMSGSKQALMSQLQEKSGCRIHIERTRTEVRLFGSKECVEEADRLLDLVAKCCIQGTVPIPESVIGAPVFTAGLAEHYNVTIWTQETHLVVLGLRMAVSKCVQQMYEMIDQVWSTKDPLPALLALDDAHVRRPLFVERSFEPGWSNDTNELLIENQQVAQDGSRTFRAQPERHHAETDWPNSGHVLKWFGETADIVRISF